MASLLVVRELFPDYRVMAPVPCRGKLVPYYLRAKKRFTVEIAEFAENINS